MDILNPSGGSAGIGGSTGNLDNAILRADGNGGSTLQSSLAIVTDTGKIVSGTDGVTAGAATTELAYAFPSGLTSGFFYDPAGGYHVGISVAGNIKFNVTPSDVNTLVSLNVTGNVILSGRVRTPLLSVTNTGSRQYFASPYGDGSRLGGVGMGAMGGATMTEVYFGYFDDSANKYDAVNIWELTTSLDAANGREIISPNDNTRNSAAAGMGLRISAGNKTAGTGNGGNLVLCGGTTVGGTLGVVQIGDTATTPKHILNTLTATPGADILTFTNGPTGTAGNPDLYIKMTINGADYAIPAFAL